MTITLRSKLEPRTSRFPLRVSYLLFLLFCLTKPFYVRYYGMPEPSDYILVLTFMVWLGEKRGDVPFRVNNRWMLLFVGALTFINLSYWFIFGTFDLLYSTAYFFYSLMVIVMFADLMLSLPFKKSLLWVLLFNILLQVLIFRSGKGRYFADIRYMGTFNDPNQFAFFLFSSFLIIYILSFHIPFKRRSFSVALVSFSFLVMLYLVVQSSSTGIFSGVLSFAAFYVIYFVFSKRTPGRVVLRLLFIGASVGVIALILSGGFIRLLASSNNFMVLRITEKLGKLSSGGIANIFIERGIDKVFSYPEYLFFGAGDGAYGRFLGSMFEVHSTFLGLMFCYGLLPFAAFAAWLAGTLRRPAFSMLPPLLALFIESFFLVNFRQPTFWMIILLSGAVSMRRPVHSSLAEATP